MEEGAIFPPVTVFFDGEHFWLADGFHRVQAAETIKLGLGCEWNINVQKETYERIKDYQARLGIATLDRVINELLDLAQDTNRDG